MSVAYEDDFWGDVSQRMVATFAMWLEEQEDGQELVAALYQVNDVLARQERGQVIPLEQAQAAFDATLRLQAVTVNNWKDMHAVFRMLAQRFVPLLPDGLETRDDGSEGCEMWHVGSYCRQSEL